MEKKNKSNKFETQIFEKLIFRYFNISHFDPYTYLTM